MGCNVLAHLNTSNYSFNLCCGSGSVWTLINLPDLDRTIGLFRKLSRNVLKAEKTKKNTISLAKSSLFTSYNLSKQSRIRTIVFWVPQHWSQHYIMNSSGILGDLLLMN